MKTEVVEKEVGVGAGVESESDSGDDGAGDRYDPHRPTGCWEGCPGRHA